MTELEFWGTKVAFPFTPYPSQKLYIEKVVEALKAGQHAVLESPTGTGKTLCLLTGVLSFRQEQFNEVQANLQMGDATQHMNSVPKIIYASRTHSQLSQVVRELKRLRENGYNVKMSVLGGRQTTCIHPVVSKEKNRVIQTSMCRSYCKAKKCHYRNKFDQLGEIKHEAVGGGVVDIEELVAWSTEKEVCPYFLSKDLSDKSDILLMPYNYLLDERMRKRHKIEVANKIIVIDEAHNIESVCEDSASLRLTSTDLAGAIRECDDIAAVYETIMADASGEDITTKSVGDLTEMYNKTAVLKEQLLQLEGRLVAEFGKYANSTGASLPPVNLFTSFHSAGFVPDNPDAALTLFKLIEEIQQFLSEKATSTKGQKLEQIISFVQFFGSFPPERLDAEMARYSFYVQAEQKKERKKEEQLFQTTDMNNAPFELNLWCFDSSKAIHSLLSEGARNIILTSGTLSPLDEYISSIGLNVQAKEPVTLTGEHVINSEQLFVATLTKARGGTELKNVFANRENQAMFGGMGDALKSVKQNSPGGLLVFHPTYTLMNIANQFWKTKEERDCLSTSNLFQRKVFNEPPGRGQMEKVAADFEEALLEDPKAGAVFQGVCRGKVSEGVDFADDRGRVCVITGIPYAPAMDPRVKLKRQYLDKRKGKVDGGAWYQIQAIRAVNQAIGRIIRHKDDFGAILFLDCRFSWPGTKQMLPSWIAQRHQVIDNPETLSLKVRGFFNKMAAYQKRGLIAPAKNIITLSGGAGRGGTKAKDRNSSKVLVPQFKSTLSVASIAKERAEVVKYSTQQPTQKPVSIFSSMDESKNSSGLNSQETKRKLSDSAEFSQVKKKRKKIRMVRSDDNLVETVLAAESSKNKDLNFQKLDKEEPDTRFRYVCYDVENLNAGEEVNSNDYKRHYSKVAKVIFERAGCVNYWAEFYEFLLKGTKKSMQKAEIEARWEDTWNVRLKDKLGPTLFDIIKSGMETATEQTNNKTVMKQVSNFSVEFVKTKKELKTLSKCLSGAEIDVLEQTSREFLPFYLTFIKQLLKRFPKSDLMTEVKSSVLALIKAKELNEKMFSRISNLANLFLPVQLHIYVIIGCFGLLKNSKEVTAQFKNRVALYLSHCGEKTPLNEEFISRITRQIRNAKFST